MRPVDGDWEQLACNLMRLAYFDARDEAVPRSPVREWHVAIEGSTRVVGCYATEDYDDRRWVLDFYRVPGRPGSRAVMPMVERIIADAEEADRIIACGVALDNLPQQLLVERCGWTPVGVLYERRTTCP